MTTRFPTCRSTVEAVRGLLDEAHVGFAARVFDYAERELAPRPEPASDEGARAEARRLVAQMGSADLYAAAAGEDLRALCLAREAIAAANPLADALVALQGLAITTLLVADSAPLREHWVPRLRSGSAIGAFAMTEPEAGSDVAAMQTRAARVAGGWRLDGEKHLISNAGIADVYVVFAVTTPGAGSRGITAFAVPAGTPGLVFAGAQVMAAPHPLGRLVLEGCVVPADAVVGEVDRGFKIGMATLDRLRPSVGAAACGMAARAVDEAVAHARGRQQFGRALAELQLVQEKLGRMATDLDAARLLVYRAAWEKDHGKERISVQAAMAKSFATEAAQRIVDEAVQVLGGRGVIVGHPVERLYRSIRALRIYEGATDVLRLIVAGALLKEGQG